MNGDQIGGIIRAIGAPITAYLAGRGLISDTMAGEVLALLATLGTGIWSWHTNKPGTVIPSK